MCVVISAATALFDMNYIFDELVPDGFERKAGASAASTSLFSPQVLVESMESLKVGKV